MGRSSGALDRVDRSAAAVARRRRFGAGVLALEIEDILAILPQRPPLLMLDRVVSLVPGEHAVAVKHVSGDEAGLDHHRHGFVFPSTFAVESLSQLGQILAANIAVPEDRDLKEPWPELVAVGNLTVHRELLAPGTIHLSVSTVGREKSDDGGERVTCVGEGSVDEGLFLEVKLELRCPPREA